MVGIGEHRRRRAFFHEASRCEHAEAVRHIEKREVVRDDHDGDRARFEPSKDLGEITSREWVEAQGFVWADAILATALLALAALSYVMLAHMLRSWGDAQQNASTTGARASPTDGGHEPASAAGSGRSASCAEYGPVEGEIEGMTALMRASSQGDEACALELIAAGAQIDARDSQEGFTALLMASAMGAPAPARPHSPCAALACLARDRRSPPLPGPACTPELELPRTACTPPQTACTPP
jgi:hypothetical protein